MSIPLFQVDAFADRPFGGNPAAVCLLTGPAEAAWMQAVAAEMNLSETAFLHPTGDGFALRWFTPTIEVALCGHATLAAAHILWVEDRLAREVPARFQTRSGVLGATRRGEEIELNFPADPPAPCEASPILAQALGAEPVYWGKGRFDYLLEVESEGTLRRLTPDFVALAALPVRGITVTARCVSGDYDFVSRFFAPGAGINEDPVTGSAHCALAPYWGSRLDKAVMVGFQASARGGVVRVRLAGDRVLLSGRAVTVVRGELTV